MSLVTKHPTSFHREKSPFLDDMIKAFLAWLSRNGYDSYDQYDYWSTAYGRLAKRLYHERKLVGAPLVFPMILLDLVLPRSRAWLVPKRRFPIADAHFIMGFLNLYQVTGTEGYLDEAINIAADLLRTSIPGYAGHCWGYPFDWQTKRGVFKTNTPLITTTPYCFEAFLHLYDVTRDKRFLDVAYSAALFAANSLNETAISERSVACSYSPVDHGTVINANAYRAFLLFEGYHRFGDTIFRDRGAKNVTFVIEQQEKDGSWPYAVGSPLDRFVDNFHTCFVLKNLFKANRYLRSNEVSEAIRRGYTFYRTALFTNRLTPRPFAVAENLQLVRVELYDYAEGISLGVLLQDEFTDAQEVAVGMAREVREKYQNKDGHFCTRVSLAGLRNNVAYLRWPQAQMFYALTSLYKDLKLKSCAE